MEWVFNGIGTQIISIAVSFLIGYKVGVYRTLKQKQIAGDNSTQTQVGGIYNVRK